MHLILSAHIRTKHPETAAGLDLLQPGLHKGHRKGRGLRRHVIEADLGAHAQRRQSALKLRRVKNRLNQSVRFRLLRNRGQLAPRTGPGLAGAAAAGGGRGPGQGKSAEITAAAAMRPRNCGRASVSQRCRRRLCLAFGTHGAES